MRKKTVNTAKRRFTLVELLVSMGVLVVILGFILQFFIGSQRLWRSMEQRNNLYADARVAMDVMTTMLQNSFYSEGGIPFRIYHPSSSEEKFRHKIYFATLTQNLPGGRLKYVSFQLGDGKKDGTGEKDELKIAVFCDTNDKFSKYFPPYLEGEIADLHKALIEVCDKLDEQLQNATPDSSKAEPGKEANYGSVLIRGVTSFQIIPYRLEFDDKFYDGKAEDYYYIYRIPDSDSDFVNGMYDNDPDTPGTASEGKPYKLPYMVELKLTMLAPADFKIWQSMGGFEKDAGDPDSSSTDQIVEFRKTHAYTFSRTVFLGEQTHMNINEE